MSPKLNIVFENVESSYLKETFKNTLERFHSLHNHIIHLKKQNIRHTTMQAQPIIDWHFFSKEKRAYKVYFREKTLIHEDIWVKDLPEEVLEGWYAHELGHIVDYQERGAREMIEFGLGYLFSDRCKVDAEKMADVYAVKYGFGKEIKAMKDFIINHADIDPKYRARIKKYYLGPEEIEHLIVEWREQEENNEN